MPFVETHAHLYSAEYDSDREATINRAIASGAEKIFLPCENISTIAPILSLCKKYPALCKAMIGLHPEEIPEEWSDCERQLQEMETKLSCDGNPFIAIGEVGIDYHFRNDNSELQRFVFSTQVHWASDYCLPLMIHARDAVDDVAKILENMDCEPCGVFHCFSGNSDEARRLLSFPRFALGIGGIITFKRSTLPTVLRECVPLTRIVLETDSPYLAPAPMRGRRNESSFIPYIATRIAEIYETTVDDVLAATSRTARQIFPKAWS